MTFWKLQGTSKVQKLVCQDEQILKVDSPFVNPGCATPSLLNQEPQILSRGEQIVKQDKMLPKWNDQVPLVLKLNFQDDQTPKSDNSLIIIPRALAFEQAQIFKCVASSLLSKARK